MPADAALSGLVRSVLRHEAAAAAVLSHTYAAGPARFNTWRDGAPLPGEGQAEYDGWLRVWQHVHLAHLDGFPLWERQVHGLPYCTRCTHTDAHARTWHM